MGQDPAGKAMLLGGVAFLAAWLAIAGATAWQFCAGVEGRSTSLWLWAGGAVTLLGGGVIAVLIVQTLAALSGKHRRAYQDYLEGLRADEARRERETSATSPSTTDENHAN